MASTKGSGAPSSFAEGMNGIVTAISATMTAPDAGPHLPLLEQLLKAAVGQIQKAQNPQPQPGAPPPGGPPGAPGGMPPGGGTNIGQLMGGGGPSGPSAGVGGGPSPSGASADDIRRMVASGAGNAT
jgi:hypothetical protein